MYEAVKLKVFDLVEPAIGSDLANKIFDVFMISLIALNVGAVILETEPDLSPYADVFWAFEVFSVAVFTVEYLLRLWSCTSQERFRGTVLGRVRFALTPMAIVDLLAVAPFFLPMFIPMDLRFARALRLFRIFRLSKSSRYSESLQSFGHVLQRKREDLTISIFVITVLLIFAASVMYFVENEAQPDKFSSILASMWWGIATLTTVGYGDVYPITPLGKFLGAIIALLGIGMFALPTGILASGFSEEIQKRHLQERLCPHCGGDLGESD